MSNSDFVKGECRNCAGHIEFPASATGQTVPCPHCGQPTVLVAAVPPYATGVSRIFARIGMIILLVGLGLGGVLYWRQNANHGGIAEAKPVSPAQSNPPAVAVATPPVAPEPQPDETTNDFAIMPFKLEKTPGSSLVYVIGTIRNLSDHQRFGVKVEFSLFDTNDNPIGSATDYQSVMEPHGDWRFKALVMASKTTSARFSSIAEDK